MTRKTEDHADREPDLVRQMRRRAELPAGQWEEVTSADEFARDTREALRERGATPPGERAAPEQESQGQNPAP